MTTWNRSRRWRRRFIMIFRVRVGEFFWMWLKSILELNIIIVRFSKFEVCFWGGRWWWFSVIIFCGRCSIILKYNVSCRSRSKLDFITIIIRIRFWMLSTTCNRYSRNLYIIIWISKVKYGYFVISILGYLVANIGVALA